MRNNKLPVLSSTETPSDFLGFFEAVALAGLENRPFRMSYSAQRKHFNGKTPFGKKQIIVDGANVTITHCGGYDKTSYTEQYYTAWELNHKLAVAEDIRRHEEAAAILAMLR
jgi:hypothetical protein